MKINHISVIHIPVLMEILMERFFKPEWPYACVLQHIRVRGSKERKLLHFTVHPPLARV
jgi:hypothetical protein